MSRLPTGPNISSDGLEIRPAATAVVLRERESVLEVLLVKRAANLAFYAGAWVFPGGRVEPEDGDLEHALLDAARRAAVRELREEAGLSVAEQDLVPIARWLTPPGRVRRFDTFYFAVRAPEQEVQIDAREASDHRWFSVSGALDARARGEIELPAPTFVTLCELAPIRTFAEATSVLGQRPVHYVPREFNLDGAHVHLYAGDAGYESDDPLAAGARHRLWIENGQWHYVRSDRG